MNDTAVQGPETPREQILYANLIILGVWCGMFLLIVTFALYVLGAISPHVPVEKIPSFWNLGAAEFGHETSWPTGWSWTGMLGNGDILTYVGFVLLALLSILGYVVLLFIYVREKSPLFAVICFMEILVLGLAASGILAAGGH